MKTRVQVNKKQQVRSLITMYTRLSEGLLFGLHGRMITRIVATREESSDESLLQEETQRKLGRSVGIQLSRQIGGGVDRQLLHLLVVSRP